MWKKWRLFSAERTYKPKEKEKKLYNITGYGSYLNCVILSNK